MKQNKSKDSLGDRMKRYEECFDTALPRRLPMVLRVDGRAFHTLTRKWKCIRPFDERLFEIMRETARQLCEQVSGTAMAYLQSDEISLVVRDDATNETQPFFDKRVQKICSVVASMASTGFNALMNHGDDPATFDCRAFVLPEPEVVNYMIWRQQDATRNSVQMLAQSLYSHKELQGRNNSDLQEMCFRKGINWDRLDTWKKRGACVVKVMTRCENQHIADAVYRNKWTLDLDIPVFTKDRAYVERNSSNKTEDVSDDSKKDV